MSLDSDIQLLSRVQLFAGFNQEQLRLLAFGAEARTLGKGTRLFGEGTMSDGGYVVVRGSIELATQNGALINTYGVGSLLGELALITDITRPGTAMAKEDTEVLKISRSLFLRMLSGFPELAEMLEDRIATNMTEFMDRLDRIRIKLDHASYLTERFRPDRASE